MANRAVAVAAVGLLGWLWVAGCGQDKPPPDDPVDAGTPPDPVVCDVPAPTACPDPMPRYADVEPLFQEHCIVCHDGTAGGPWSLVGYNHVADWQDIIPPNLRDCSMPPRDAGSDITVEERVLILTWIRCGLPQ